MGQVVDDTVGKDRVMTFADSRSKDKHFFMDCTIESCSTQFAQHYTIHQAIGTVEEENNIMPVM